jgi:hypothetical protein
MIKTRDSPLAVWGKNDPFFVPAGAQAFSRDNPEAQIHFCRTGHFALETHCREIAVTIRDFLARSSAHSRYRGGDGSMAPLQVTNVANS